MLGVGGLAALTAPTDWRPTLATALLGDDDPAAVDLDDDTPGVSRVERSDDPSRAVDAGFELRDDQRPAPTASCAAQDCARWSLTLGPRDRLVADDDHVVVATTSRILAVDTRTARGRWQIARPPGDGPIDTLHLLDDAVLLARDDALTLRTMDRGDARWTRAIGVRDVTDVQRLGEVVLVTAGTIPGLPGAGVQALDAATGAPRWTRETLDVRLPILRIDGPHLAVQTSPERIVGVDPVTGRSRWVRAGRVGFTDAAILLAADDGRVERLVTASGGSGATISSAVQDVLAAGPWTVVRDRDATSRLVDDRGRVVDERAQPALALAGTTEGALVAYRDGDDIEVVRYDALGVALSREPVPGGIDAWGGAPRLGFAGDSGLVISTDGRRTLRLAAAPVSATAVDDWPLGTVTTALGDVLVAAGPTAVELRGGAAPLRIEGRLRGAIRVGGDVLVQTDEAVVQIAAGALRP